MRSSGRVVRAALVSASLASVLASIACVGPFAGGAPLRAKAPAMPTELAKCQVAANHENPLVTEWPASEKANLEARLREGGVVVAYAGCSMKLLPQCRVRGGYGWRRTTTATDVVEIHDADELYAKLPLGAVTLEGELSRSGRLAVQTTVSGQLELRGWDKGLPTDPACNGATHVVGALSVGSFKLRSGGTLAAKGGVDVAGVGSGAVGTKSAETIVREAGSPNSCKDSSPDAPHGECSSPIQVFLWALPKELADRGPAGSVKVNFLSANTEHQYEVAVADRVLCQTPCSRWVDPAVPFTFKHDPGWIQRAERIEVPDLREHQDQGLRLDARAYPTKTAKLVGGILMTTFGGLSIATGIVLTSVGFSMKDQTGMRVAGLITLPAGIALAVPGIVFIAGSSSYVDIRPEGPGEAAPVTKPGAKGIRLSGSF